MTSPLFVLCLLRLFLVENVQTTDVDFSPSVHGENDFISATIGDNVTMQCFFETGGMVTKLHWYKQTLGQIPRLMSTYYKYNSATFHDEFENNPRFSLDTAKENNHLTITNLQVSDSATYLCAFSFSDVFEYSESITVSVENSGSSLQALVHQSASNSIQPGNALTLNYTVHTGTCDGEHSVYWFRDSGEPHSGLIYTNGGKNGQCERNPDEQTHSCIYQLPMNSVNRSHAGTYYCAVASCGHILFGNGTTLDVEDDEDSVVLVYFLSGALTFTTTMIFLMIISVCRMKKIYSESQAQLPTSSLTNAEVYRAKENVQHAAGTEDKKEGAKRGRTDDTWSECVYFRLKQ